MTMNKIDHIEAEVRETMEVLDRLPEVEPHYLFRARLLERIGHEAEQPFHRVRPSSGGLKLALMAFLLIINIGSALLLMFSNGNEPAFSKTDMFESLTSEYSSPALSYYLDNDSIEDTGEQ